LAKCEELGYQSPLWRERYPRLARTMAENPLQPLGNVMHSNLMIGCKKPFDLREGVDPKWLDRENNVELSLPDAPELFQGSSSSRLDLTKLLPLWQQVPDFAPIPIDKIGPQRN
jgi:hypothetical protein